MGSGPESWLTAWAMAREGMRAALLLERAPDPGLPPFHCLPVDPSRSAALLEPLGIRPAGLPANPLIPDFQVILAGLPVDMNFHPHHRESCLERDLGKRAHVFNRISEELHARAEKLVSEAAEAAFPSPGSFGRGKLSLLERALRAGRLRKSFKPGPSPPFSMLASEADPGLRALFLAACSAAAGVPLTGDESADRVALLWALCHGLHEQAGSCTDFREQVSAAICEKGGEVLEGPAGEVVVKGGSVKRIELGERTVITRALIAPAAVLRSLPLKRRKKEQGPRKRSAARTFFFRVDKSTLPDSLAMRAVVVKDPDQKLKRDNLIIMTRAPRVPRRDTLCVTVLSPRPALDVKAVPVMLAASLPWLDPARVEIDDMREQETARLLFPPPGLSVPREYESGIENAMPLASEVLAEWGLLGLVPGLRVQVSIMKELKR